ncbi:hypothetical protein FOG18_06210 [Legionella israelensis]|uniref:hypothetical protein n=1 Tax=Legionella israelensis TaxID=454 RepID=UPI00117D15D4|nr:hypothetical protein [Legionella israelensis]QDP72184.1 hypothetical protein FOG18_06210 [Legionella israelensis]
MDEFVMSVPAHPDKDIKQALDQASKNGWTFKKLGTGGHSHAWGQITCPAKSQGLPHTEWCKIIIYGSPQNASNIAQRILRKLQRCNH